MINALRLLLVITSGSSSRRSSGVGNLLKNLTTGESSSRLRTSGRRDLFGKPHRERVEVSHHVHPSYSRYVCCGVPNDRRI